VGAPGYEAVFGDRGGQPGGPVPHQTGKPLSKAWLAKAYDYAQRDYALWSAPPHLAGDTGLARYDDIGEGPVPEMADDSNYYPDVIRWLLAHPEVHTDYLVDAPDNPTPAQAAELAKTSCDIAYQMGPRWNDEGHRPARLLSRR
jgi:alpha,alpha-trehalase